MCGIVGYIGKRDAAPLLIEGLRRLEYRGYDSAGMAIAQRRAAARPQAQGQGARAREALPAEVAGSPGIAHTRWATHGEPSDVNAHPHADADEPDRGGPQRHHRERRGRCATRLEADGRRLPLARPTPRCWRT